MRLMCRAWLASTLCLFAALDTPTAAADATTSSITASIAGSFDVTLSGSASYSLPLRIAPGTAGMEPKIALAYDSQAPGGPLGAGWSISGISAITRGPKNARTDGVPDGVRLAETDALYLDGQRIIPISVSGSGASRRIEYRKEVDDQTRIVENGINFDDAVFIVSTKGGLTLEFYAGQAPDLEHNRGNVQFGDGRVLLRAISRIKDSAGNYIDFYYRVNGSGDYDVRSIHYTGHLNTSVESPIDRKPYAYIDFNYENVDKVSENYVAGALLRSNSRLISIGSYVSEVPEDDPNLKWVLASRYSFDYEERESANRFVLKAIHQYGADGLSLAPTIFNYTTPSLGWADSKFPFPAVLAERENFAEAYRFAHFSTVPGGLPDLMFSAEIDGKVESFAFMNKGNGWSAAPDFKPPVAFNKKGYGDLGVIVADVTGGGRVDLLQSYQTGATAPVNSSYLATDSGWKLQGTDPTQLNFNLPFVVSRDGKVVAQYRLENWSGAAGPDLLYQSGADRGFLANKGTGWGPDPRYTPPVDLGPRVWDVDVDCSGKPALLAEAKDAHGAPAWKVFRFGPTGWDPAPDSFKPRIPADIDPEAIRIITVDGSKCPALLVATAQKGGIHAVLQASSAGWVPIASKTPPFDLVDGVGNPSGAIVAPIAGPAKPGDPILSDVLANRIRADGSSTKFAYFQTATGWHAATPGYTIPVLSSPNTPAVFVGDFNGDGRADIVLPISSRQQFGRVFLACDSGIACSAGFTEQQDYTPPVAFTRKDQQDLGVRMVDLNGDGLPDLLVSRAGGDQGAWLNFGQNGIALAGAVCSKGWCQSDGLKPPVPFAGDDISGNPVQFVDVDGDGFLDLIHSYQRKDGTYEAHFYRNADDGTGGRKWFDEAADMPGLVPPPYPGENHPYPFSAYKIGDMGVRFADLDGSGRPYMLIGFQPGGAGTSPKLAAFRNEGKRWVPAPEYAPPVPFVAQVGSESDAPSYDLSVQIIDVNGDGLPDIVAKYHDPKNPSNIVEGVWLNTGHGWVKSNIGVPLMLDTLTWDAENGLHADKNANIRWLDLNGDGIPDIVYTRLDGANDYSKTFLGTGTGWVESTNLKIPTEALANRSGDPGFRLIDINGDGYPDLLVSRLDGDDGKITKRLYLNFGNKWVEKDASLVPNVPFVDKSGNDLGVRLFDVDGRGLVDLIQAYRGDGNQIQANIKLNNARRSDVIDGIDAGYGLVTHVYYQTFLEGDPQDLGPIPLRAVQF